MVLEWTKLEVYVTGTSANYDVDPLQIDECETNFRILEPSDKKRSFEESGDFYFQQYKRNPIFNDKESMKRAKSMKDQKEDKVVSYYFFLFNRSNF